MIRIKSGKCTRKRHKKIIKLSKSFRGSQSKLFKTSNQRVIKSLKNSYADRKKKKNFYKNLWINRINIFCKMNKINYSKMKENIRNKRILLNSKIISNLCIFDSVAIKRLLATNKSI